MATRGEADGKVKCGGRVEAVLARYRVWSLESRAADATSEENGVDMCANALGHGDGAGATDTIPNKEADWIDHYWHFQVR